MSGPPVESRRPRPQSLADFVYDELLARLFDATVKAGEPLRIGAISTELDVSPTPVREALARLESTGLVVRSALRGYRVAPMLTPKELSDLMDARYVLEPELARRATRRVSDEFTDALAAAIDDLAVAPTGPTFADYQAYLEADERFHDLIARQADNAFLYRAYESIGGQAQRFRLFSGHGVSDADRAIPEHQAILAQIRADDAAGAAAAMARHVLRVKESALAESTSSQP